MIASEKLDRIYVCRQCGVAFLFRQDKEDHCVSSGHTEIIEFPLDNMAKK